MKIWENTYDKINAYSHDVNGTVNFRFNKKELSKALFEVHNSIEKLNEKYSDFELVHELSWNFTSAILYWRRPLNEEEKLEVKRLRKIENEKAKKLQLAYAKKLAKKFRLIK